MPIIGSGYIPQDTFAFFKTNPNLQYMSMEEFENRTGITGKALNTEYWNARDVFVAQRVIDIGHAQWNDGSFKFNLGKAENNLFANRKAWDAMQDIFEHGGNVLAFDTETIGDFAGSLTDDAAKYAGITEIGFASEKFLNASGSAQGVRGISNPPGSFFFGIDDKQKSWLESVLEKKVRGETLTSTEMSAMERASRHSTLGTDGFKTFTGTWNGKEYTFVRQLNASRPDSIEDIRSGIDAMYARYNVNREEQINSVVDYINGFTNPSNGKHRVVVGQNLAYDVNVIDRYSKLHGTHNLSDSFEYADSMFALRSYASANNTTVAEIIKQYNPRVSNERLGSLEAMVEAITDSVTYSGGLAHNAYEDSLATLQVFKNNGLGVVDKAIATLNNIQSEPNTISLENSYVKINSRGNIRSNDMVIINDRPTTNYQVSNQFWKFEGVGTTNFQGVTYKDKTIVDSSSRYLARFSSASGDGATLFKSFESQADFEGWLRRSTSMVLMDQADVPLQTRMHDLDIARRVIDGFFDVGQVSQHYSSVVNQTVDAGGFAGFQNYYRMYQELASLSDSAVSSMNIFDAANNQITTAQGLLQNISTGDNIANIIEYADQHELDSVISHFRNTVRTQDRNLYTAQDLAVRSYDERKVMQQVFDMFGNNSEFFDYANSHLTEINSNLMRTMAFSDMQQEYLKTANQLIHDSTYTLDDLNTVSMLNKNGRTVRINVDDIDAGASQLLRAFSVKGETSKASSDRLFEQLQDLQKRGLITNPDRITSITNTHMAGKQPATLAQSIVSALHAETEDIRRLGAQTAQSIREDIASGMSIEDISATRNIADTTIQKLIDKDARTLMQSSMSEMANVSGTMSESLRDFAQSAIANSKQATLISGSLDDDMIKSQIYGMLSGMGYDDESIKSFGAIFYRNGQTATNLAQFNKTISGEQQGLQAIFYRTKANEASAFMMFTRDTDYAKLMSTLSHLDEYSTAKEVKKAINGLAGYFEIPYLDVLNLASDDNDIIKNITGRDPRAVLVKQGENFYRYDTMSLNIYRNKEGQITGGIRGQGGDYLTSMRQRALQAYEAGSRGNYDDMSRALNNPNIARMSEEASPQMGGTFDLNGRAGKMRSITQKDIGYAHTIALDPGEGNLGLKDLMSHMVQEDTYKTLAAENSQASTALRGIYNAFNDKYKIARQTKGGITETGAEMVFGSEPFQHFYQRYLTDQTGGIGSEQIIKDFIAKGSPDSQEIQALMALRDKSLLQILAQATQENPNATDDLRNTLDLLANHAQLDAVGSESYAKHMMMYIGGYSPEMMNNNRLSATMRPTYTQRMNYRSYRNDGMFFSDADELASSLGIKFGDVYTSDQYIRNIKAMDAVAHERAGLEFSSKTASQRSIIGAVQSLSDTEIQAQKGASLAYLEAHAGDLNIDSLKAVYERMLNDVNTYEGKAYMRPSLANQTFFSMGDPKSIRSAEIEMISQLGTDAEKKATVARLGELIDKRVVTGEVIGYRLDPTNESRFIPITYKGQTIDKFTEQNASELFETGKTYVTTERQLEGFKVMFDEEKATAESLAYFRSIDQSAREAEIKETLASFGIAYKDNFEDNVRLMNQYTDAAYDALTFTNQTAYRTILIGNNNINKHLTDMSISSRWNIIMSQFQGEQGLRDLQAIASNITLNDGSSFISHLGYDDIYRTITFDNPTMTGSVNVLDQLITALRNSDDTRAKTAISVIEEFNKNGIALQSIQRQQMNTFQGQAFKMDQRVYQGLVMQADGRYTTETGAKLAEYIRSHIQSGAYDEFENMGRVGGDPNSILNRTWHSIVANRRGKLQPHQETSMLLGVVDAIDYAQNKFDINTKNIVHVDVEDILENIPKSGAGAEGYKNFIFRVDGQDTRFIRSLAQTGTGNANLNATSNSFYLDLSRFGKFDFNGQKGLTGIVLPYQYINSTADDSIFVGESTKATIRFFNQLKALDERQTANQGEKIAAALDELFRAYGRELDSSDKKSLITKAMYKMKMPSSSGALAKDALSPTANIEYGMLQEARDLRYAINTALYANFNISDNRDLIDRLNTNLSDQSKIIKAQQANILTENDPVRLLNLTSGNPKYSQYLRHFDGNLDVTNVIESAVTTSKEMFRDTSMDTGFIGHQVLTDYFSGDIAGLKKYDSLSRFHRNVQNGRLVYNVNGTISNIYEAGKFSILDEDFMSFITDFTKTFQNTNHIDWAEKTSDAMRRIMETPGDYFTRQKNAVRYLEDSIDNYMRRGIKAMSGLDLDDALQRSINSNLTSVDQQNFILNLNKAFEVFGDRYASEVGIFGFTNRYPNFNETGTLPVRIYLDDTLSGKEIRFLGPQFSIAQNLDFDGDTEFLKFLGNGGLMAKDSVEAELFAAQFEYMNGKNRHIFSEAVADSVKAYQYGDEASFKAALLKDLGEEKYYGPAVDSFRRSISNTDLEWFDSLEGDVQDIIIAHTKQMKEAFTEFDEALGASVTNADMVKAAIQARIAKNYIGNYSKPNLEIRNAMTYMMSLAEGDELQTLQDIRDILFSFDTVDGKKGLSTKARGLLTELEQKGIDTKHVHDAATLNNSSAWRAGVSQLFANANGADNIDRAQIQDAMTDLVEGARKVFFTGTDKSNAELAREIIETPFQEWNGLLDTAFKTDDSVLLGKIYLSGLYEMSQRNNAYQGYFTNFRSKNWRDFTDFINGMSEQDINDMIASLPASNRADLDLIAERGMLEAARHGGRTDDAFMAYGRAIRQGDLLLYQSDDGPVGYVFKGMADSKIKQAIFEEYDLNKRTLTGIEHKLGNAITIKELNEQIKRDGNRALLDYSRLDVPEKNINDIYIDNLGTKAYNEAVRTHAAVTSIESRLQDLFDNIDDADIINRVDIAKNQRGIIHTYDSRNLGNVMSEIIGPDSARFVSGVKDIQERLQYGIESGMVRMSGSTDAKELMRAINREIAANPRPIISDQPDKMMIDYLESHLNKDVYITNEDFLTRSIAQIKLSNAIASDFNNAISARDANLNELARSFYGDLTSGMDEDQAFKTVKEAWQNEIDNATKAIRSAIEQAGSEVEQKGEMMRLFGWNNFKNDNFIIDLDGATMRSVGPQYNTLANARIGYGQFTGTKLGDLTAIQKNIISREIAESLDSLEENSLDYIAAKNTRTLIDATSGIQGQATLNFSTADTLRTSYRQIFNPDVADQAATKAAQEALNEAAANAAREAAGNVEKKTLLKSLTSFKISPEAGRAFKVGAGIVGGVAALGLVGHALFNNDSNDDVEVPTSVERELKQHGGSGGNIPRIKNKNDLGYENAPSDAQSTQRQHKPVAPPSLPKNRTIYHDAASGFNFKVSAQSYNKLQEESYQRMANGAGLTNNNLRVTRDNSRITDNWLENKFAQLTE